MLSPIEWIKTYAIYLLLASTAAGFAWGGIQTARISSLKLDAAKVAQKAATERADRETEVRVASENYRRTEADLRARVDTAEGKYDALQNQHAATLAAHHATDDQLRSQLATFARGNPAPGNTCAAESARAEALGVLLSDGLRLQEGLAGDAEAASDAVRALKAAWPNR